MRAHEDAMYVLMMAEDCPWDVHEACLEGSHL